MKLFALLLSILSLSAAPSIQVTNQVFAVEYNYLMKYRSRQVDFVINDNMKRSGYQIDTSVDLKKWTPLLLVETHRGYTRVVVPCSNDYFFYRVTWRYSYE